MERTRKSLLLMLVLMLVVLGTSLVSGTYAKYTTEVTGTSEAAIAGWAWEINDETLNKDTTTYALDLFKTINDSDATTVETNVKESLIAPGTSGKFEISIKNNSEVNATYAYELSVENDLGAKIQWSDDNSTWTNNIADLNVSATTLTMGSEAVKKTIYWKWVFDESADQDIEDTKVGFSAASTNDSDITVNATLNFVQVD